MLAITLAATLAPRPAAPADEPAATASPTAQADIPTRIAALQEAIAAEPLNAAAQFELGLLLALDQPETAHRALQAAADLDPAYAEAAQSVRTTLAQANLPTTDPAYAAILIGQALAAQQEWGAAAVAFERSAELDPAYAEAWAYLGEAQNQLGQEGLPALHTALQLNPNSLAGNLFAAAHWNRRGEPAEAVPYLQTANTLQPDTPAILTDLGITLAAAGEVQAGLEALVRVTELTPERLAAWQTLAEVSLAHNVQVELIGLAAARQSVLMAGEEPYALTLMGRAYALLEDTFNAERFFERALAAGPDYAPAHLQYGRMLVAAGRLAEARLLLARALELAGPDDPTGQQAAEALRVYFP